MRIELSDHQKDHIDIMKGIVGSVNDLPITPKGGTALLLGYGLDRFSEDLDFDANKKLNIKTRVEKILKNKTTDYSINLVKNTQTVQRYKIHYVKNERKGILKIETSYRDIFTNDDVIEKGFEGVRIKIYKVEKLLDQKLLAAEHRSEARDLYDINFLISTYLSHFNQKALRKIMNFVDNINNLEDKYRYSFQEDYLFDEDDLSAVLLNLDEQVDSVRSQIDNLKVCI